MQRPNIQSNMKDNTEKLENYIRKGDLSSNLSTKSESFSCPDDTNLTIEGTIDKHIINNMQTLSPIRHLVSLQSISGNYLDVVLQTKEYQCKWGINITDNTFSL